MTRLAAKVTQPEEGTSPKLHKSHTQIKSSEISPNETTLEVTMNEGLKTLEEPFTHIREDTEVKPRGGPTQEQLKSNKGYMQKDLKYKIQHHPQQNTTITHLPQGQKEIQRLQLC